MKPTPVEAQDHRGEHGPYESDGAEVQWALEYVPSKRAKPTVLFRAMGDSLSVPSCGANAIDCRPAPCGGGREAAATPQPVETPTIAS